MQKQLKLLALALCLTPLSLQAQTTETSLQEMKAATEMDENQFTFTESQLGEDDDLSENVTIISSNNDIYASQVGYGFSATRFRYRAFNQKYNDIYINGMQMNDMETGQFRYSLVGGLNNQTRSAEAVLPFEDNTFSLAGMGGSNNYNFRAGSMATGHRVSILGTNRNYTARGMYTYSSGFSPKGWAVTGNLTYRWANRGYVKGTFYNSLSYFLGVEKLLGNSHSLSFATWGNPTERSSQGAATDEAYWLANSNYYNPYWGYQNGKVRNSRVINDFAPSALLTWDWQINDHAKLTTTLGGRYSMYKSTKLNYNNSDNPQPDYWKRMPSSFYDVYDQDDNSDQDMANWYTAYEYWTASEANRQINWDQLYYSNQGANKQGMDAMYFIQAKNNDALTLQLNSVLNLKLDETKNFNVGFGAGANHGRHYQTMEDLLGATSYHNINTYAVGTYAPTADEVQYDLNNRDAEVGEGDVFGYDYYINVRKANLWASYAVDARRIHFMIGARTSYTDMQRDGRMRNGLAADNSYGKSGTAHFLDGGLKTSMTVNMGGGSAFSLGVGFDSRAPQASTAFAAPEINNDFVLGLRNEQVFSSQASYQLRTSRLNLNLNGYYTYVQHGTEWQNFYFDDVNSFTYLSITNVKKAYYGVELGAKLKLLSTLDFVAFGTYSEAKYTDNCDYRYMLSTKGTYSQTRTLYSKDMRESGTPLTALSFGLSYHNSGWFVDLAAKYYDRIYLSWSPCLRYEETLETMGLLNQTTVDEDGNTITKTEVYEQTKGHGGWMLDGSIGRNIYLKRGSLSINLSLTNILNNTNIVTGGYEQSRSSYTSTRTTDSEGNVTATMNNARVYDFYKNPKKYYAYGINGMLNITYKF